MNKRTIGLLGGIGPESTGRFYLKLIERFVRSNNPKTNTEYPHVIINSIPAPELTLHEGTSEILNPYIDGLRFLEQSQVSFIAIICNTAYVYLDVLQNKISIPIIDIRKELEKKLKDLKIESVTVLGTPYTIKNGLYNFECFKNTTVDREDTERLTESISNYNIGFEKEKQQKVVCDLVSKYSKYSDVVILGCSEVAIMATGVNASTIDPMDVLIESILSKYSNA